MPVRFSEPMGFRLCGIADDPFCPVPNDSSASRTSLRWRWRISTAMVSMVVPTRARAARYWAWRSRGSTWVETGAARRPSRSHVSRSTSGGMLANVPTAPDSLPTRTASAAASNRTRSRWTAS